MVAVIILYYSTQFMTQADSQSTNICNCICALLTGEETEAQKGELTSLTAPREYGILHSYHLILAT